MSWRVGLVIVCLVVIFAMFPPLFFLVLSFFDRQFFLLVGVALLVLIVGKVLMTPSREG